MINKLKQVQQNTKKVNWGIIIILYVLQILIFQFMLRVTFPVIQENLGELQMFDMMKNGYDVSIAERILAVMGEEGRNLYLHVQMPIDFVYPVLMAVVYYLVLVKTSTTFRYSYYVFPVLLILCDWMENICIIWMLSGHMVTRGLVAFCNICTRTKAIVGDYILYFASLIGIVVYVIRWFRNRHINKNTEEDERG